MIEQIFHYGNWLAYFIAGVFVCLQYLKKEAKQPGIIFVFAWFWPYWMVLVAIDRLARERK